MRKLIFAIALLFAGSTVAHAHVLDEDFYWGLAPGYADLEDMELGVASALLGCIRISASKAGLAPPGTSTTSVSWRSEEHTSELQSRENLVCRLLLEKKNTTTS